jgi:hypothetical protein
MNSDVMPSNSQIPESEVKQKFLPKVKKLCEAANKKIKTAQSEAERAQPKQIYNENLMSQTIQPSAQKIPKIKPDSVLDNDQAYLICSIASDLNLRQIVTASYPALKRLGVSEFVIASGKVQKRERKPYLTAEEQASGGRLGGDDIAAGRVAAHEPSPR